MELVFCSFMLVTTSIVWAKGGLVLCCGNSIITAGAQHEHVKGYGERSSNVFLSDRLSSVDCSVGRFTDT